MQINVNKTGRVNKKRQTKIRVGKDIELVEEKYIELIRYLRTRLDDNKDIRSSFIERLTAIDQSLFGSDTPEEDCNPTKNERRPVTRKQLPLTLSQLEDISSYMADVIAPENGLYATVTDVNIKDQVSVFMQIMNQHGRKYNHYSAIVRMILDALKYNFGGLAVDWHTHHGKAQIEVADTKVLTGSKEDAIIYAGNELTPIDPYNFLWDGAVDLRKINLEGEFAAIVRTVSRFHIHKAQKEKKLYGEDIALYTKGLNKKHSDLHSYQPKYGYTSAKENAYGYERSESNTANAHYYRKPPSIKQFVQKTQSPNKTDCTNFSQFLSYDANDTIASGELEYVDIYIRLIPAEFGLSDSNDYEMWHFVLSCGFNLLKAEPLLADHGMLPVAITVPQDSVYGQGTPSISEMLHPLQEVVIDEFTAHNASLRKKLSGGMTIYNPLKIPLDVATDPTNGYIPARNTEHDEDLRKSVLQLNDTPDTSNTMANVQQYMALMQQVVPTANNQQVADMDRATQYAAAAAVLGNSRRLFKIAKCTDEQALSDAKVLQFYNILANSSTVKVRLPQTGELQDVDPTKLNDRDVMHSVVEGMKGIDRLQAAAALREMIHMLIQNKQLSETTDMHELMSHYANIQGDHTDYSSFRIEHPIDNMPIEMKNQLMQLVQQAQAGQNPTEGGNAVVPDGTE